MKEPDPFRPRGLVKLDFQIKYWVVFTASLILLLVAMQINSYSLTATVEGNKMLLTTHEVLRQLEEISMAVNELRHAPAAVAEQLRSENANRLVHLRRLLLENPAQLARLSDLERELRSGGTPEPVLRQMREAESQLLKQRNLQVSLDSQDRQNGLRFFSVAVLLLYPLALLGVGRELVHRRRAERALRESESWHRDLYQLAPCGYHSLDAQGRYLEVNQTELSWTGYSREELLGRPFVEFLSQADRPRFEEGFAVLQKLGQVSDLELEFRQQSGDWLPLSLNATATYGERGEFLGGRVLLTELGQRKQLEGELRRARDEALELARLKAEFLATMSHEIRTPLFGVLGMTGLLQNTPLSPEQREYTATIQHSSDSLLSVINDILDYSKIEAGCLELKSEPVDPETLLDSCFSVVAGAAAEKDLDLAYRIDDYHPFLADGARLRQVLINLLGNAVKFTPAGEVTAHLLRRGDWLEVSVSDTGVGIAAERMDQLFQPFRQVDASSTRQYGGTGLGLSISQRLISLMGGEISVDSQPGQGSCFRLRIPYQPDPTRLEDPLEKFSLRVLVVDDNQTCREILSGLLAELGADCACAPAAGDFDLAVVDPKLGPVPGVTYPQLAWCPVGVPAPGFQGTLRKPVGLRGLARRLREWREGDPNQPSPLAFDPRLAERHPLDIVIADDVPTNLRVLSQSLAGFGYSCRMAHNGREVLELLQRQPCQLLLLDLHMPELDGFETARQLIAAGSPPRIVVVTADALPADRDRCLEIGIDEILLKPFGIAELKAVLVGSSLDQASRQRLQGLAALDPSGDFLREVVESALADFSEFRAGLVAALDSGEPARIREAAHRFKGVAASVGAVRLAAVLAEDGPLDLARVDRELEAARRSLAQMG